MLLSIINILNLTPANHLVNVEKKFPKIYGGNELLEILISPGDISFLVMG